MFFNESIKQKNLRFSIQDGASLNQLTACYNLEALPNFSWLRGSNQPIDEFPISMPVEMTDLPASHVRLPDGQAKKNNKNNFTDVPLYWLAQRDSHNGLW